MFSSIIMFMVLVVISMVVFMLILMGMGLSFWGVLFVVVVCLNVLGLVFGELGSNF